MLRSCPSFSSSGNARVRHQLVEFVPQIDPSLIQWSLDWFTKHASIRHIGWKVNMITTVRMRSGTSPEVGWEWKWFNDVWKGESSIFWCMYLNYSGQLSQSRLRWRREWPVSEVAGGIKDLHPDQLFIAWYQGLWEFSIITTHLSLRKTRKLLYICLFVCERATPHRPEYTLRLSNTGIIRNCVFSFERKKSRNLFPLLPGLNCKEWSASWSIIIVMQQGLWEFSIIIMDLSLR